MWEFIGASYCFETLGNWNYCTLRVSWLDCFINFLFFFLFSVLLLISAVWLVIWDERDILRLLDFFDEFIIKLLKTYFRPKLASQRFLLQGRYFWLTHDFILLFLSEPKYFWFEETFLWNFTSHFLIIMMLKRRKILFVWLVELFWLFFYWALSQKPSDLHLVLRNLRDVILFSLGSCSWVSLACLNLFSALLDFSAYFLLLAHLRVLVLRPLELNIRQIHRKSRINLTFLLQKLYEFLCNHFS